MDKQEAWKSWQIAESAIDCYTSADLARMFHFACLIGYAEKAVMLYDLVHDVAQRGQPDTLICDPADIAADLARTGHLETLHALENAGFDLLPHLDTSLALAAEFGHTDFCRYLAQRGANAAAFGGEALRHAAEKKDASMLKDILAYRRYSDAELYEIADEAVCGNRIDILDVIFKSGFDIHHHGEALLCKALSRSSSGTALLDFLKDNGADPVPPDQKPLQTVISNTVLRNCNWVLEQGADPIYLPQKFYDSGLKNKVLGDNLQLAVTHHAKEARLRCSRIVWKNAIDAPDFADLVADAARGGELRDVIEILAVQPAEIRDRYLSLDALQAPLPGREVSLKDVIWRTGQHKTLFDARIWRGRAGEMQTLFDSLPETVKSDIGAEIFQELKEYDLADARRAALKAKKPSFPTPR